MPGLGRQRDPAEEDEETKDAKAAGELEEQERLRQTAEREQEELEKAEGELCAAMQDSPDLAGMAQNLIIDNAPEDLRIQLADQEKASMFPSGDSHMNDNLKKILEKVADTVHPMPNYTNPLYH